MPTQAENAAIKARGGRPRAGRTIRPSAGMEDTDARWTKKHDKSHYGYKNHVSVDRKHKLIRQFAVKLYSHDACPRFSHDYTTISVVTGH